MTNEELYQLMKDSFDQFNQRFNQIDQRLDRMDDRLNEMDARLRTVENDISELKGKQSVIPGIRNWITISCAVSAMIICTVVAILK